MHVIVVNGKPEKAGKQKKGQRNSLKERVYRLLEGRNIKEHGSGCRRTLPPRFRWQTQPAASRRILANG